MNLPGVPTEFRLSLAARATTREGLYRALVQVEQDLLRGDGPFLCQSPEFGYRALVCEELVTEPCEPPTVTDSEADA